MHTKLKFHKHVHTAMMSDVLQICAEKDWSKMHCDLDYHVKIRICVFLESK